MDIDASLNLPFSLSQTIKSPLLIHSYSPLTTDPESVLKIFSIKMAFNFEQIPISIGYGNVLFAQNLTIMISQIYLPLVFKKIPVFTIVIVVLRRDLGWT